MIPSLFTGISILAVDPVLLPLGIQIDCIGGPRVSTGITVSASGKESRFAYMTKSRREYSGAFGPDEVEELLQLWESGLGPRYAFMLYDPKDHDLVDVPLLKTFANDKTYLQLAKLYVRRHWQTQAVVREVRRDILLPDPDTVTLTLDGVTDVTSNFTLADDGVMYSDTIYGADPADIITATCTRFFVGARVLGDPLDIRSHVKETHSVQQIRFQEVLPGDVP